jgi:hypothetical protein
MTPQPHDFKSVAEEVEKVIDKTGWPYKGAICGDSGMIFNPQETETIRFALRLAERVCGETTYEMRQAGSQKVGSDFEVRGTFGIAEDVFKAMISEALKEIENG